MNEWIACKDKMPKMNQRVLVYEKDSKHGYDIDIDWYDGIFWFFKQDGEKPKVTHWMPLPEEPK